MTSISAVALLTGTLELACAESLITLCKKCVRLERRDGQGAVRAARPQGLGQRRGHAS